MVRWSATVIGGIVMTLLFCGAAAAAQRLEYPCPCPNACVPNGAGFGYFATTWRQWPGEQRLDRMNPQAIGREVLTAPEGQEQVPLPRATAPDATTPESGILPPPAVNPSVPGSLRTPDAPGQQGEGGLGLPGLPVEPRTLQTPPPSDPLDMPPQMMPTPRSTPKVEQEKPKDNFQKPKETPQPKPNLEKTGPKAWRDNKGWPTAGVERAHGTTADSREAGAVSPAVGDATRNYGRVEAASYNAMQPRIAMNGFCPVELARNGRWTQGDLQWTVVHQGFVYRFSGPSQRQQFMADPNAYLPAYSGNDAVLAVDQNRTMPGQPNYCATYNGKLYMFTSAATQSQFGRNPKKYAAGQ